MLTVVVHSNLIVVKDLVDQVNVSQFQNQEVEVLLVEVLVQAEVIHVEVAVQEDQVPMTIEMIEMIDGGTLDVTFSTETIITDAEVEAIIEDQDLMIDVMIEIEIEMVDVVMMAGHGGNLFIKNNI